MCVDCVCEQCDGLSRVLVLSSAILLCLQASARWQRTAARTGKQLKAFALNRLLAGARCGVGTCGTCVREVLL